MSRQTLLIGLAHPDDELTVAGTALAQRARGDRVIIVWLSRGELTEAFGPLPPDQVALRREEQGRRAAEILDVEGRFLDLPDTEISYDRATLLRLARLVCELAPDALVTWGDAWVRGMRHPDHQICGRLFRDAITLARIAKVVDPVKPHRAPVPVFTIRGIHSTLPTTAIDVTPHRDRIAVLAEHYHRGLGFGDPDWLDRRLREVGRRWNMDYAEELDAWETEPIGCDALLPAPPLVGIIHPERIDAREIEF